MSESNHGNHVVTGYDTDFYKWTQETAQAIAEGRWTEIDRLALADEVESLGKRDRKVIRSRLAVLIQHLLKSKYQPAKATRSWAKSILNQRIQIAQTLNDSPSLQTQLEQLIAEAYPLAVLKAAFETGLPESSFPPNCEWSPAEILGRVAGIPD